MLSKEMSLQKMLQFEPNEEDMLMLPLDAVVYMKTTVVSMSKEENYDFIRHFFSNIEVKDYINDIPKTLFFDFDGTSTDKEKFITIFEMTSKSVFDELSIYLEEVLKSYNHDAFVFIDLFTHTSKKYRLSDLDGIIKLEELKNE